MTERVVNAFATTLAAAIADAVTTAITVVSNAGAPSPNFRVIVDNEIMVVTSVGSGTNWTVQRGAEGTTAAAHTIGSAVIHVLTAGAIAQMFLDAISADGALLASNNLSDVASASTARTSLGLGTGNSPTFTGLTLGASGTQVSAFCDIANAITWRNGASAQAQYLHGTYTDSGNYERLAFLTSASGMDIITQQAGTGTARHLRFGTNNTLRWEFMTSGHFVAIADASYHIGQPGANRPLNGYFAGAVAVKVKAGQPTDSDFTNPVDGMIAVDSTNSKIWVRLGGVWKGAALT